MRFIMRSIPLLAMLIGLYLLMNLSFILFAPILHHATLEITVLDSSSGLPLQRVEISWLQTNPATGFQWTTPFGVTNAEGSLKSNLTVQEQPLWVYPMLGSFQFRNRTLQMRKDGYDATMVDLSKAIPPTPYGSPVVAVTATLREKV